MKRIIAPLFLLTLICLLAPQPATAVITIPTVPVGNLGNGDDPLTGSLYGGVAYAYRIGTTEVTNAQYAAFLNEKAKSDPLELYSASMGSNARGGITRSGLIGSFTYAAGTIMANKPVNFVTWYSSIRFANWLNNGQGAGDTETGAYTILGNTPDPSNADSITRNVGATWFLPSENEWYKAAYYQPAAQGGDADNYWLYPTRSNNVPTVAAANGVGDISNPGANVGNYNLGADWNAQDGNVTTVRSAGLLSDGFYGTADQQGNVSEWNETLIGESFRGRRGGSWYEPSKNISSDPRYTWERPPGRGPDLGFRVATVPEPSSIALLALGLLPLVGRRRPRRSGLALTTDGEGGPGIRRQRTADDEGDEAMHATCQGEP